MPFVSGYRGLDQSMPNRFSLKNLIKEMVACWLTFATSSESVIKLFSIIRLNFRDLD